MSPEISKLMKEMREKAEKATPGEWFHVQPFMTVPGVMTLHGPVMAKRVDFVSTAVAYPHGQSIISMPGGPCHTKSNDMAYISTVSPANILKLLDYFERVEMNEHPNP